MKYFEPKFYYQITNEERIQTCTTNELIDILFNIAVACSHCGDESHNDKEKIKKCPFGKLYCTKEDWKKWLNTKVINNKNKI